MIDTKETRCGDSGYRHASPRNQPQVSHMSITGITTLPLSNPSHPIVGRAKASVAGGGPLLFQDMSPHLRHTRSATTLVIKHKRGQQTERPNGTHPCGQDDNDAWKGRSHRGSPSPLALTLSQPETRHNTVGAKMNLHRKTLFDFLTFF